ncbi:arginyl-tRNA synthetase [Hesseltinella vesiculosa]|uniref:arginine--tRNA ligase n=1 Tax=Hesseltinella vesiculosa TaxID=101127 RepID=A0A1X2G8X6_9FUNG|nr:arginyl-tRNA synthetase [Hesseltinella vesiculosa]
MELTLAKSSIAKQVLCALVLGQLEDKVQLKTGTETTLKVNDTTSLKGDVTVTRYLIRLAKLVDELAPSKQREAAVVDALLLNNVDTANALVQQKEHAYLIADQPTIADYLAWAVLAGQSSDYVSAVQSTAVVEKVTALSQSTESSSATAPSITIPDTDASTNPLDTFRLRIAAKIAAMGNVDPALVYKAIEIPRQLDNGDFALTLPRLRLKGNPAQIAKDWAASFVPDDLILSATATGPFLNFRINTGLLVKQTLAMVTSASEQYGCNTSGNGKKAIVEFSSPNIAKPFHAGHLRSTIIGSFIRNVYKANGWDVLAMNYLGDWGKQYGLLAVGYGRYGDETKLKEDPIKHLYDVYVEINKDAAEDATIHDEARAYFKKMEDGDEQALALWRRFRDLSIVKYQDVYARLNIHFDIYSGESQVTKGMDEAMAMLIQTGLLEDSQGAKVINLEKYKLGVAVVQKSDGTTLYLTRDIGAAKERFEKYNFDKMIYVVAAQQDLHLKQLFKTLDLMGFEWANRVEHVNFGMVQGMSTRKGTVVFLEDIINEAQDIMHEQMRKNEAKYAEVQNPMAVADEIGISGVRIQDNAARRVKNYEFDRNRMFSFEGDTGPYIQYAHARLCSIERKNNMQVNPNADTSLLTEEGAINIVRIVAEFPDLLKSLMNAYEPCNVVTYAFKLSHEISAVFDSLWVRGADPAVADARLLMYWSARVTLGNAMRLLGLRPLERM